jgi:hypothetical protein
MVRHSRSPGPFELPAVAERPSGGMGESDDPEIMRGLRHAEIGSISGNAL